MSNPLTMFHDDDGQWSMTRCVAALFAFAICTSILIMARQNVLHSVGWPFCTLGAATLLAVPLQALFRALVEWLKSKPGAELIGRLVRKIGDVDVSATASAAAVTTTTTVNPPAEDTQ